MTTEASPFFQPEGIGIAFLVLIFDAVAKELEKSGNGSQILSVPRPIWKPFGRKIA